MSIKAAGLPDQVATITTSIDAGSGGVLIQWVEPHDGSQAITEYLVEIADVNTASWHEDSTNCDGSDPSLTSCLIPMDVLVTAPYSLVFDQLVQVRVTAINSYGPGTPSEVNTDGARARRRPVQIPSVSVLTFTDTTVTLSWDALVGTDAGNSAILTYDLYFDDATGGGFVALASDPSTVYLVQGLSGGVVYQFQVRAVNVYGSGDFSPAVSVTASNIPGKPSIPVVELQGTGVVLTWEAPFHHYAAITSYEVALITASRGDVYDLTNCDASTDPVFSALSCTIPMVDIPSLTSLSVDQLI